MSRYRCCESPGNYSKCFFPPIPGWPNSCLTVCLTHFRPSRTDRLTSPRISSPWPTPCFAPQFLEHDLFLLNRSCHSCWLRLHVFLVIRDGRPRIFPIGNAISIYGTLDKRQKFVNEHNLCSFEQKFPVILLFVSLSALCWRMASLPPRLLLLLLLGLLTGYAKTSYFLSLLPRSRSFDSKFMTRCGTPQEQ